MPFSPPVLRAAVLPAAGARRRGAPEPACPAVTSMSCRGGLPGSGGLVPLDLPCALGRAADGDLDPPRPHRLGHLALQLDNQQAVLEAGALHLHEVGEVEAPLEAARRQAAVEVLAAPVGGPLAGNHHQVRLALD